MSKIWGLDRKKAARGGKRVKDIYGTLLFLEEKTIYYEDLKCKIMKLAS
jgi:hypothetical protein